MTPYDEGFQAFKKGIDVRDNPYDRGDSKWQDWDEGWFDAKSSAGRQNEEFSMDRKDDDSE